MFGRSTMAAILGLLIFTTSFVLLGSASFLSSKVDINHLHFSYSGATGPAKWAGLSPNNSLCTTGKMQLYFGIVTAQADDITNLKLLLRDYRAVNVTLVYYKFTVGIEYPNHTGEIITDDKKDSMKQIHWHSLSEHRFNGKRFAAELQMVHVSDDGKVFVVVTLFNYGCTNPVLVKIYKKLYGMKIAAAATPISIGMFHPPELRTTPTKYFKYTGSCSVPPCIKNIFYLVHAYARTISKEAREDSGTKQDSGEEAIVEGLLNEN